MPLAQCLGAATEAILRIAEGAQPASSHSPNSRSSPQPPFASRVHSQPPGDHSGSLSSKISDLVCKSDRCQGHDGSLHPPKKWQFPGWWRELGLVFERKTTLSRFGDIQYWNVSCQVVKTVSAFDDRVGILMNALPESERLVKWLMRTKLVERREDRTVSGPLCRRVPRKSFIVINKKTPHPSEVRMPLIRSSGIDHLTRGGLLCCRV